MKLIEANQAKECGSTLFNDPILKMAVNAVVDNCPAVDAVVLPQGKPGDYLEWDNGTGFKQIYAIHSVMICEDCIRYDLEKFAPVVNHPGIVRIMSLEQAEREWHEMCEKAKAKEEPTLTAVCGERRTDGN